MQQEERERNADLISGKLFLVLFPTTLDTIAGLGPIRSLLFGGLVSTIFFSRLLRVKVAEPLGILLQGRWVVERVRVGGWAS